MSWGDWFSIAVFSVVSVQLAWELMSGWPPPNPVTHFCNWLLALNGSQAAITDVIEAHWVLLPPHAISAILAFLLIRRDWKRGQRSRVERLIGDKSKAVLRKMTEKMRELKPMPAPLPEPV